MTDRDQERSGLASEGASGARDAPRAGGWDLIGDQGQPAFAKRGGNAPDEAERGFSSSQGAAGYGDGGASAYGQMAAGSSDSGLGGYGGAGAGGYGQPNLNSQWGQGGYAPLNQGLDYGQGGSRFGATGFGGGGFGSSPRPNTQHDQHLPSFHHWRETQLSNHDRDYAKWRSEQTRRYDEEYGSWRNERHSAFSKEFEGWRAGRGGQAVSAAPATTPSADARGAESTLEERYGSSSQPQTNAPLEQGFAHGANPTLARIADGDDGHRHRHDSHERDGRAPGDERTDR